MTLQSRGARVLRGSCVAVASVVIAALSHVAAGGAAPGALGAGLALVFAVLTCVGLAGRSLSIGRLSIAVGLSQLVFHVLFSLGAAIPAAHGHVVSMLGMVMSGGNSSMLPQLSTTHGVSALEAEGARMWAGHAVAAVLTVVVLLHGERALFTLARLATGRLALLVSAASAVPEPLEIARHDVSAAISDRRGIRALEPTVSVAARRGPPRAV